MRNSIVNREVRSWLGKFRKVSLQERITLRHTIASYVLHTLRLHAGDGITRDVYKSVSKFDRGEVKTKARHTTPRQYKQKSFEQSIKNSSNMGISLGTKNTGLINSLRSIANKLESSTITKAEARAELQSLVEVPDELLSEYNLSITYHDYGLYRLKQSGKYLREDSEQGCHKGAWGIIEKSE